MGSRSHRWRLVKSHIWSKEVFIEFRERMMNCQLGAGMVSIHGQKLSPWAGTLGWVAENREMSDKCDDLLAGVFFKRRGVSVAVGLGEGGQTGFSSLCRR